MPPGQHHIGTSGWIYKHWKDLFYRGVKQAQWLAHYAAHFPTVEINNTFYRKPTPRAMAALADRTPDGFLYAIKMWRGITHYRKLKDSSDLLAKFMPLIAEIPPSRRGPLLVQLPGGFKRNIERLDAFLADLRRSMDRPAWRVAVEFRDPDWLHPESYVILDRHNVALCLADMPQCPVTEPNAADFIYVRRHGIEGTYGGTYLPEQIAADARRIKQWLAAGRDVFIYYNNDIGGHAVTDARNLAEALSKGNSRATGTFVD